MQSPHWGQLVHRSPLHFSLPMNVSVSSRAPSQVKPPGWKGEIWGVNSSNLPMAQSGDPSFACLAEDITFGIFPEHFTHHQQATALIFVRPFTPKFYLTAEVFFSRSNPLVFNQRFLGLQIKLAQWKQMGCTTKQSLDLKLQLFEVRKHKNCSHLILFYVTYRLLPLFSRPCGHSCMFVHSLWPFLHISELDRRTWSRGRG